ncbi:response regulator transcription factor [Crossiella sp. SN42]|uniref:response regulator transcription factor n=1 Tax=Crossiella sp. SN42 TaxID=2944808 RepID=UPI0035ABAA33
MGLPGFGMIMGPIVGRRESCRAAATSPPQPDPRRLAALTEREREVLATVGAGCSNDEIAALLHINPATARNHVSRLLTKLHARDRAQLVVLAYETGLITPGSR